MTTCEALPRQQCCVVTGCHRRAEWCIEATIERDGTVRVYTTLYACNDSFHQAVARERARQTVEEDGIVSINPYVPAQEAEA